jgi:hypothetical protein
MDDAVADALFIADAGIADAGIADAVADAGADAGADAVADAGIAFLEASVALETVGFFFLTDGPLTGGSLTGGSDCSARSTSRIFMSALPNTFSPHFAGSFESTFSKEIPMPIISSPGSYAPIIAFLVSNNLAANSGYRLNLARFT